MYTAGLCDTAHAGHDQEDRCLVQLQDQALNAGVYPGIRIVLVYGSGGRDVLSH